MDTQKFLSLFQEVLARKLNHTILFLPFNTNLD